MIPTSSRHGQGTWVLRVGPWRYLIFLGRVKPHSLPDHQVLSPSMAAMVMDLWFRDRLIDRYRQAALYWEFNPASTDLSGVGESQLEAWLVDAVATGSLRICKFSHRPGEKPSSSSLKPPAASRTHTDAPTPVYIGHEVARKPANLLTGEPAQDIPVAVFAGTGNAAGAGLPDETDATCPSDNHRS